MEVLDAQLRADPDRVRRLQALEEFTALYQHPLSKRSANTIPVVVHVLYRTGVENISQAQVISQIRVLNEDFRRLNADRDDAWSQASDTEIEFCLASIDPDGRATTGILRTQTNVEEFGVRDAVKFSSSGGADAWPAGDYLNIWVCNIGHDILGYAQYPGGSALTDGVVIDYRFFGAEGSVEAPYDLGRTTTHEVGHWLNLHHVWGDGGCGASDLVADTPDSDGPHLGCGHSRTTCGSEDMIQNYMDYTDDACMNLFTAGQKGRMQATLASTRSSLLRSHGCGAPGGGGDCQEQAVTLTLVTDGYASETSWSLTGPDGEVAGGSGLGDHQTVIETFCLPAGCYEFTIMDSYGDGICCLYGDGFYQLAGSGVEASGGTFGDRESVSFCLDEGGGGEAAGCTEVDLFEDDFERNYGNWLDGGADCFRSRLRSIEGGVSIYLRDNTSASVLTSPVMDLSGFESLTVSFDYLTSSMEEGEDFWLQLDRGDGFETAAKWTSGTDFKNDSTYRASITLEEDFGTANRVRFRNDASADTDYVHLDNISLSGCTNGPVGTVVAKLRGTGYEAPESDAVELDVRISPNPAEEWVSITVDEPGCELSLRSLDGRVVLGMDLQDTDTQIRTGDLPSGMYLLVVKSESGLRKVTKLILR